jgi:hypothetical protein
MYSFLHSIITLVYTVIKLLVTLVLYVTAFGAKQCTNFLIDLVCAVWSLYITSLKTIFNYCPLILLAVAVLGVAL